MPSQHFGEQFVPVYISMHRHLDDLLNFSFVEIGELSLHGKLVCIGR